MYTIAYIINAEKRTKEEYRNTQHCELQ